MSRAKERGPCRHCGKTLMLAPGNRLCSGCEATHGWKYGCRDHDDVTMAELDAIVGEQMRHLPAWWDAETAKQQTTT